MILSAIWRIGMWGLVGGVVLGGLYGTLFAPEFFLFGALIGGMVGGVVGMLNGLLAGVITRTHFNPLTDPKRYRRTIGIASALFTGIAALIGFLMFIGGFFGMFLSPLTCWGDILPATIAAATAFFASRRYAGWYIGDDHKPKKKKHAPD